MIHPLRNLRSFSTARLPAAFDPATRSPSDHAINPMLQPPMSFVAASQLHIRTRRTLLFWARTTSESTTHHRLSPTLNKCFLPYKYFFRYHWQSNQLFSILQSHWTALKDTPFSNTFSHKRVIVNFWRKLIPRGKLLLKETKLLVSVLFSMFFIVTSTLFVHKPLCLKQIPVEPPCWIKKEGLWPVWPLFRRSQRSRIDTLLYTQFYSQRYLQNYTPHITLTPSDGKLQLI
jgi:hypothetical protein